MEYYLRVEGVNLDHFVFDTNDLNTIRGGGLLMLDAVECVEKRLKQILGTAPETITRGASWGLFRFSTQQQNAGEIARDVLDELNSDENYKHATFVANVLPAGKEYEQERDKLFALNRWQQMQSSSIVFPRPDKEICALDRVRPARKKDTEFIDGKEENISASVKVRRKYGQGQKRELFYSKRTKIKKLEFTNHFESLSANQDKENLNCKMAVIYLDGNDFGKKIRSLARSPKVQNQIDKKLREQQNAFLKKLVRKANKNKSGDWKFEDKYIRLETLLWGGDEVMLVVPAWHGWDVIKMFYDMDFKLKGENLTHAGGLVFCHHNAPIHRVKQLAENLADLAKKDKSKNSFAYQVIKSFDHAGMDLVSFRKRHSEGFVYKSDEIDGMVINADNGNLEKIEKCFSSLKEQHEPEFPKRKLQQIVHSIRHNPSKCCKYVEALEKESEEIKNILKQLRELFSDDSNAMWLHLIELWDFVGEKERRQ